MYANDKYIEVNVRVNLTWLIAVHYLLNKLKNVNCTSGFATCMAIK